MVYYINRSRRKNHGVERIVETEKSAVRYRWCNHNLDFDYYLCDKSNESSKGRFQTKRECD